MTEQPKPGDIVLFEDEANAEILVLLKVTPKRGPQKHSTRPTGHFLFSSGNVWVEYMDHLKRSKVRENMYYLFDTI